MRVDDSTDADADFIRESRQDVPALCAALREVLALLRECEEHMQELRDAWERGVFDEHDGRGGTRSNRNVEVLVKLQALLAAEEARRE